MADLVSGLALALFEVYRLRRKKFGNFASTLTSWRTRTALAACLEKGDGSTVLGDSP